MRKKRNIDRNVHMLIVDVVDAADWQLKNSRNTIDAHVR